VAGILSRWILRRVLASGLAFEREAINAYRVLREKLLKPGRCDEALEGSLCHLLEEEQVHERILSEAAAGRLSPEELEEALKAHRYAGFDAIRPLEGDEADRWRPDLAAALQQEEKTWIFYGNLRRMSKIPAVRKAFEVLATMEKEHVDILRRLLGMTSGEQNP
jgi:rubrerythrin